MNEIKKILGVLYPIAETIGQYIGNKISEGIDNVFPPEDNDGKSSDEPENKSNE